MKAEQQYVTAKTSVWWDIENCPVPKGCDTHAIAQNISSALAKLNYNGPVSISAYGDTTRFPSVVQQALSSTGIALNHVPSGVKDASDKKILVDMLFWAVDNPPPANYLLISGDRDFSNALHQLRLRRYNILLAQPQKASAPLLAAAKTVWLWSSLLAGGPPNHPNFHQQKSTPVKNKPSVCHDKKNKSPSVLECQSTSSAPSSPDIPSNDTWGTPVHTKPAKYIQLRVKVVLLALDALKNEKIMPTQSNIADCIRYGDPKHRNTDVRKGLECAVEQQMIVQQNRGTVQFYVRKNENLWECVDPLGGNANEYPKTTWTEIKSFLTSSTGRSAVLASQCRYEAGTIIKRLCLKQLALGEVLQILNMTITAKRWIMHHESGWQPLKIFLAAANTSIPEDQPSTSSAPSADIPDNGTSGFPGCPKPSECMQGPVEAILLTLDTLKNEQIMPTEANIADCIQYGDPKHQNIDVRKGLESALEQQKIVQQNVGTVQLYIGKNEEMWKCVDPFNCNANVYPKAIWTEIKNFLTSSIGRSAILASQCRYEAGTIIKRLCFKQLPLGEVLRILNMTITVKRWIIHHQSGWQPLKIVLAAGAPPLSRKRKADCSCEGQY